MRRTSPTGPLPGMAAVHPRRERGRRHSGRRRLGVVTTLVVVASLTMSVGPSAGDASLASVPSVPSVPSVGSASYYLSVGDSLAQGYQPIGGPHSNSSAVGYAHGYADQLLDLAQGGGSERLRLVKLGCGGESTASMIADSRCPYETGSQLGDAVKFLDEHAGEVAFVTINIGSNDLVLDCGVDPVCAAAQIATNLPHILTTLRQHAGPDVPIIGMNYYSPFVVEWFDSPIVGVLAAWATVAFNDVLELVYGLHRVPVADVESAFAVTDFVTQRHLTGVGLVPLSVYNACTLTWYCTGPPLGPDIHANTAGHGVIAATLADTLGV